METPVWVTILLALIAAGAGVLIKGLLERGREPALIQKITAQAHEQIYASYGELIGELRQDAALGREEARAARTEAREAQLRAAEAEVRAAGAETRAVQAQASLAEIVGLIRQHVPAGEAEQLLAKIERLVNRVGLGMAAVPVSPTTVAPR